MSAARLHVVVHWFWLEGVRRCPGGTVSRGRGWGNEKWFAFWKGRLRWPVAVLDMDLLWFRFVGDSLLVLSRQATEEVPAAQTEREGAAMGQGQSRLLVQVL